MGTLEATPASVPSDGTFLLLWVPALGIADPSAPTVTELTAGTVKKLTYSLTPDGFNHSTTEDTIDDGRLSIVQMLQRAGTVTDTLEVKYVFGSAGDIAAAALTPGTSGFLVPRYAIPNETDITATTQKVDVLPISCGIQRKNPPTRNGVWTKSQTLFITSVVQRDVAIATGA